MARFAEKVFYRQGSAQFFMLPPRVNTKAKAIAWSKQTVSYGSVTKADVFEASASKRLGEKIARVVK